VETVELLLVLPILVIATIAIIEFGILLMFHQAVIDAATAGAREAGKGGNVNAVALKVNRFLSPFDVGIAGVGPSLGNIVLEDGLNPPVLYNPGGPACDPPPSPAVGANEVRVTVCLAIHSPSGKPVPDWLSVFGFSLSGRKFEVSALVRKE
jgi:hypothetical protein